MPQESPELYWPVQSKSRALYFNLQPLSTIPKPLPYNRWGVMINGSCYFLDNKKQTRNSLKQQITRQLQHSNSTRSNANALVEAWCRCIERLELDKEQRSCIVYFNFLTDSNSNLNSTQGSLFTVMPQELLELYWTVKSQSRAPFLNLYLVFDRELSSMYKGAVADAWYSKTDRGRGHSA